MQSQSQLQTHKQEARREAGKELETKVKTKRNAEDAIKNDIILKPRRATSPSTHFAHTHIVVHIRTL